MDRTAKSQVVESIVERFGRSKAAFLVDFKGITVEQVTVLRKKLRPIQSEMKVVRNTLALRALADKPAKKQVFESQLIGTNAFVFAYEDAAATAKLLMDYVKDVEKLQLKMGEMDDKKLDANAIKVLATLPSKDVLRAMFLGTLQAPMGKFVRTLAEVPGGFVRVLNAHKTKLGN